MHTILKSSSSDQAQVAQRSSQASAADDGQLEITYVATHLPYPVDLGGGERATHGVLQAIGPLASVSVMVLTGTCYDQERICAAERYYRKICRSLTCYTFPDLSPGPSPLLKAWHYLSGYPRQGFWSKEAEKVLLEHVRQTKADVVWCDTTYEAKYLRAAKAIGCRTVLSTQNVESDLVRQDLKTLRGKSKVKQWVRWRDLRRLEKFAARWADIMTGITTVDLKYYYRIRKPDRVFLLPEPYVIANDSGFFDQNGEEPNTICFVGSMEWAPNVKAARYLVEGLMPIIWKSIPDAKCLLVGRNPGPELRALASERVIVTGTVPSLREYYEKATVVVVPILGVGGVKVKSMEAMAYGKAVVASPAGATGLDVESGKQLIIADSPREFAEAVLELLGDRSQRQRLGVEARRFVAERLSPEQAQGHAEKILQCLRQL